MSEEEEALRLADHAEKIAPARSGVVDMYDASIVLARAVARMRGIEAALVEIRDHAAHAKNHGVPELVIESLGARERLFLRLDAGEMK